MFVIWVKTRLLDGLIGNNFNERKMFFFWDVSLNRRMIATSLNWFELNSILQSTIVKSSILPYIGNSNLFLYIVNVMKHIAMLLLFLLTKLLPSP